MTNLADRLLAQLHRMGSMATTAVPPTFGVDDGAAAGAIADLLADERAYRAGSRIFASIGIVNTATARGPAGPTREVNSPPSAPPRAKAPVSADPPKLQSRPPATASAVPRVTKEPSSTMASNEKTCRGACGESKPATTEYFHKHPSTRDGLDGICKVCKAAAHRARANGSSAALKKKAPSETSGGGQRQAQKPGAGAAQQAHRRTDDRRSGDPQYPCRLSYRAAAQDCGWPRPHALLRRPVVCPAH